MNGWRKQGLLGESGKFQVHLWPFRTVSQNAHAGLSLPFPLCCGRNSGLVAFVLIYSDIFFLSS